MLDFFLDQLDDPEVTARAMFGGHGVYRDGRMFALVYGDVVYMKVDEEEAKSSEREPFRPPSGQTFPSFREVPVDVLEDPEKLRGYAEDAHLAASG